MNPPPPKACAEPGPDLPDELAPLIEQWFEDLEKLHPGSVASCDDPGDFLACLQKIVACSEFAANVILRDWQWFDTQRKDAALARSPDRSSLAKFAARIGQCRDDVNTVKKRLRQFRNRWLLHVLWRQICGDAELGEIMHALSDLADGLISACARYTTGAVQDSFGVPRKSDGTEIPIVILSMGKLGGRELNFSSDVDLIFLYVAEGETDGTRSISAHEYFTRVTRQIVALLDEVTSDGIVFRVDTRLRPFGESGPPVTSFAALESYLPQHGRGWERYAYVKARVSGTTGPDAVATELMADIIDPFVYRRYLDFGVFESLREMKALIAAEVRRKELASNIKLGPGGIREVEFIVQSLQLVRGGREKRLRGQELQAILPRLANHRGLSSAAVSDLISAYDFLRRLENVVQALRDQQRHEIPIEPADRARICLGMNYPNWENFSADLGQHRANVTQHFEKFAFGGQPETSVATETAAIAQHWLSDSTPDAWQELFNAQGFSETRQLAEVLVKFRHAASLRQTDKIARRRLDVFIPKLLSELRNTAAASTVLARVLEIVDQIARRSAYIALLNENPLVRERLVSLCASSAYLTDQISQFPLLLDELIDPRIFSASMSANEMKDELRETMERFAPTDSESRMEVLAQFQRATRFRIAVGDFSGNLPIMKVSDRLTDLAELVLNEALQMAYADLIRSHGAPTYLHGRHGRTAGFGVVAYGKFGGIELSYVSDLDLVFLHESGDGGRDAQPGNLTDGERPLEFTVFFGRLVQRLVHFLTVQTGSGALYEIDMRLRPSGRSGLLVTSLEAFERYQEENAWTWEHQALLRSRPVAGSARVAREFERIRAQTLRNRVRQSQLLEDVTSMRRKMRGELDRSSCDVFDLKQGLGGIGDIEFMVQYLVLKHANQHPAVIHYPDNIRQLGTLAAAKCLRQKDAQALQDIYKKYRLRLHRLALDDQPSLVPESEFVSEREFVTGLWAQVMS